MAVDSTMTEGDSELDTGTKTSPETVPQPANNSPLNPAVVVDDSALQ